MLVTCLFIWKKREEKWKCFSFDEERRKTSKIIKEFLAARIKRQNAEEWKWWREKQDEFFFVITQLCMINMKKTWKCVKTKNSRNKFREKRLKIHVENMKTPKKKTNFLCFKWKVFCFFSNKIVSSEFEFFFQMGWGRVSGLSLKIVLDCLQPLTIFRKTAKQKKTFKD